MAGLRHVSTVSLLGILALMLGSSCSGCKDNTVFAQRVESGTEISLHHRVCGSVSGYAVRIAPPQAGDPEDVDASEPFFLVCDCREASVKPPVQIATRAPRIVIIRYDPARVWRIEKQRSNQGGWRVLYETENQK